MGHDPVQVTSCTFTEPTGLRQAADSYAGTDNKTAAGLDETMPTAPNNNPGAGRGAI